MKYAFVETFCKRLKMPVSIRILALQGLWRGQSKKRKYRIFVLVCHHNVGQYAAANSCLSIADHNTLYNYEILESDSPPTYKLF